MFDIEIVMYLLFVLLASLIYQIIIIYYRTKRRPTVHKQTQTNVKHSSIGIQTDLTKLPVKIHTDIQNLSAQTQTEAINFSTSLKRKQNNQVFGYRTFQFKPVMNQPNTSEQEPLPGGRGQILHTLSIRGVGRGTTLG